MNHYIVIGEIRRYLVTWFNTESGKEGALIVGAVDRDEAFHVARFSLRVAEVDPRLSGAYKVKEIVEVQW